jgi:diaminopimelate decarboxylase
LTARRRQGGPDTTALSLAAEVRRSGTLGGIAPEALAQEFGTPFYVYDLDLMGHRVEALRAVLPARFRLAYAVKANPALAVVAHLARCGVGADIASGGELEAVLRAGLDPALVTMTGPGKRDQELVAAVSAGVGIITVESQRELHRLEAIAATAGRRQPILLRLAVAEDARLETVQLIGGAGGKFGMPVESALEAARHAAASAHLELLGVHAFGASNLLDGGAFAGHVAELADVGRRVASEAGVPLRLVDAGGGLGIPYADDQRVLDLALLGAHLAELSAAWEADPVLRQTAVLLEPGRFLVGPAGAYVARVVDVKGSEKAPVAILEGGINHAVRPALVCQEQRLAVLAPDAGARRQVPTTVAGPLCTGLDVFSMAATLPRPQVGDLVALLDAGAYGFTEAMPFFLSHPTPAEIAVRAGRARLIRPRLTTGELLERQTIPDW